MFRIAAVLVGLIALLAPALGQPAPAPLFETKAAQAFLVDGGTGAVLYQKDPDTPFPPASLAKLMTVEVVFHALKNGRLSMHDQFVVSEHAWRKGGAPSGTATMFAAVKSSVPVAALIQGIIVQQANDACIILAEAMAGSEENFAKLMNERARAIGLKTSTFVNPTGLPAEGHQVTAREMVLLAQHLQREYPQYYRYFSQPEFEWNRILQRNRNPLLRLDIGVDGLGSGFTEGIGYSIAASQKRGDRRVFAALAAIPSEEERVEETRKMLEWAMSAFQQRQLFAAGEIVGEASVYGGEEGSVPLRPQGPLVALVPAAGHEQPVSARIAYQGPLPAPVEEGTQVAKLQVWLGDTLSQETPLYAAESVAAGTLRQRAFGAVQELLVGWMR